MRCSGRSHVLLALLACSSGLWAQIAPDTYWVEFTDKASTPYSLAQADQFLSARALARRTAQGITLDDLDLPVDPAYINAVLATGEVQLLNQSKWFNGITIRSTDPATVAIIEGLPMVGAVRAVRSGMAPRGPNTRLDATIPLMSPRDGEPETYGPSYTQVAMLNGQVLHAQGAQGQGMLIGVLDSGFLGVDSALAFGDLRDRGGIVLTRDLVANDGDVYDDHWHGRCVFSCMAAHLEGQLLGTAPAADYVLLRTEDVDSEFPVEEDHWIAGAELADSLGCDVLNTSLGYTTFDDSTMDHSHEQLDGLSTRMSIAMNIASRKGMVPVVSAGNNGQSEWRRISIPADARDVLAVGAVGDVENHAPFSSFGPSHDGRVKPDVCAMGWGTIVLREYTDSVVAGNGTSFASPVLAGLVACLWQLHPERTSFQIMDAVRRSASFFSEPNDSLGYGVPDFAAAHAWLQLTASVDVPVAPEAGIYPVPFLDELNLVLPASEGTALHYMLFDATGRAVLLGRVLAGLDGRTRIGTPGLVPGRYTLRVEQGGSVRSFPLIKTQ